MILSTQMFLMNKSWAGSIRQTTLKVTSSSKMPFKEPSLLVRRSSFTNRGKKARIKNRPSRFLIIKIILKDPLRGKKCPTKPRFWMVLMQDPRTMKVGGPIRPSPGRGLTFYRRTRWALTTETKSRILRMNLSTSQSQ